MIKIDLHIHSNFSDGTLPPKAIVQRAKRLGISVLSLTDHDTVDGVQVFMRECAKVGLQCLSGVELSAEAPFELHILGYRVQVEKIDRHLKTIRAYRKERNIAICEKLKGLGINVSIEELEKEAGGDVIARPHIARLMAKKGYVPDERTAFAWYLKRGGGAYVERKRFSPSECINIIKEAGGLPVLAHPALMGLDEDSERSLVEKLVNEGLWGIECFASCHTGEQRIKWSKIADRYGLYKTAGSDFHDGVRPGRRLGVSVPVDLLPWARLGVSL